MTRPKKTKNKRRSLWMGVRLSPQTRRRLDEFADKQELNRSQVVRAALNEFMDRRASGEA